MYHFEPVLGGASTPCLFYLTGGGSGFRVPGLRAHWHSRSARLATGQIISGTGPQAVRNVTIKEATRDRNDSD